MTSFPALSGAIIDGNEPKAQRQTESLLAAGYAAAAILEEVCIPAMQHVRQSVDNGDLYLPDLFISQRAYQSALATLSPHLSTQTYAQALAFGETDVTCFL